MIIQCENCQAKFRLDDSKIPPQGRKVRCSKCQHVFFVQKTPPPPPPPIEEEEMDIRLDEDQLAAPAPQVPAAQEPAPAPAREPEEAFEPTVRIDLSAHEDLDYHEEQEAAAPPPRTKRRVPKLLIAAAALIVLLAVAGVVLNQLGLLPFLSSAPPETPVANLVIAQAQLEGKWEKNAQVPRIFVINGTVKNGSKTPRGFIKVRGLLLDKGNKPLKDVWAYCGNPIPAQDLRTKAQAEIENIMRTRDGQGGMNKQLAPNATIPFTVVFFDVPDGVESFGAEVLEAQIPAGAPK